MVLSIVLGVVGMAISTMGMKCTKCGGDDKVKKARIAMTGGFIFLLGGKYQAGGGICFHGGWCAQRFWGDSSRRWISS